MKDFDFELPKTRPLTGHVVIPRHLAELTVWKKKPFDPAHALVDLFLLANTEAGTTYVRGIPVNFKSGWVLWSVKGLADRWGWRRESTGQFLRLLADFEIVRILEPNQYGKIIELVDYRLALMDSEPDSEPDTHLDSEPDTDGVDRDVGDEGDGRVPPPKIVSGSNHPDLACVLDWFAVNDSGYSAKQVTEAFNSFQATALDDGKVWYFGKRPVTDWRSAMATRLAKPDMTGDSQKNGGAKALAGSRGVWATKQKIEELEREIASHPANRESSAFTGEPSDVEAADLAEKKKALLQARREVTGA